jgi:hypothetical protein
VSVLQDLPHDVEADVSARAGQEDSHGFHSAPRDRFAFRWNELLGIICSLQRPIGRATTWVSPRHKNGT